MHFRPMTIDPRFQSVADRFFALFPTPRSGGGSVAIYLEGDLVLDVWAGWAGADRRWTSDTVSMCFSTGKGVASTVLHRLADRGLVSYDDPVAQHWPEFGQAGKDKITVRELMSHRAGLHKIMGLVPGARGLLDTQSLVAALAASPPDVRRLRGPGYHAVTYGTLVGELAARITGQTFTQLVAQEIAEPLGVQELWFEVPQTERHRVARVFPKINPSPIPWSASSRMLSRLPGVRGIAEAGMPEGFDQLARSPEAHDVAMPGWNGVFSAPALGAMYAALANGGQFGGTEFLSSGTVKQVLEVQTRDRDYVLGIRPNWRLGFHPAWVKIEEQPRGSIGHYGFGGSGAFADPETGLSMAFVTNRLGNNLQPITDGRLSGLGGASITIARRLA